MHHLPSLFSNCSLQFLIVSNTVKMHHLQSLFSFYSQQFQIVLSTVTMHALETLFPSISLQFQIVSNYTRVHALETLFSFLLCSSKSFQILSECMNAQRPICNKYILNTERKVFTYRWFNFVVKSLHYFIEEYLFWQTLQNIKLFPSKHALKCPKMQLRRYRISEFSEGACLRTPLN